VKRIRAWLALLLFLHAVVHPLVHTAPLLATAAGSPTLSAPAVKKYAPSHDCQLCRTSNSVVRVVAFAVQRPRSSSSALVLQPVSEVFGTAELQFPARAPPSS